MNIERVNVWNQFFPSSVLVSLYAVTKVLSQIWRLLFWRMGEQVLFPNHFGRLTCLICNDSVNKEFNIKRHNDTRRTNVSTFMGLTRKDKPNRRKNGLKKQRSVFQTQTTCSCQLQGSTINSKRQETFYWWRICEKNVWWQL